MLFLFKGVVLNQVKKKNVKKIGKFSKAYISHKLLSQCSSNLVCKIVYMQDIKHVNLIEIGPVV